MPERLDLANRAPLSSSGFSPLAMVRLRCEQAEGPRISVRQMELASEGSGSGRRSRGACPAAVRLPNCSKPKSQGEPDFLWDTDGAIIGHDAAAFNHERWLIARVCRQIVHVGWRTRR